MTLMDNFSPHQFVSFSKEILLSIFPLAGICDHILETQGILFTFHKHAYYHLDLNLELKIVNIVRYDTLGNDGSNYEGKAPAEQD